VTKVFYSFPHVLGRPGIGTTAWHQVQGLIDAGAEVHVVSSACERPIAGIASHVESMTFGGVRIPRRVLGADRAWHLHDRLAARLLRRMREKVDVVHCWPSGALETLRAARECGIPSFLERPSAHTRYVIEAVRRECAHLGIEQPGDHYSGSPGRRLQREEVEWASADYLVCPSEFVGRTFREYGFQERALVYHQYGYDPVKFFPSPTPARSSLTALYCGEGIPLKGLHIALDAWCASAAAERGTFLIAGEVMPSLARALKSQLAHPSVKLLGFRRDVAELMRASDVLVLPSMAEGSALVTYEARACGCVLMVSDAAGARCEHLRTGLVHPAGDKRILAEQFDLLAGQPLLLAEIRRASLADARNWTWLAAAVRLEHVYRMCSAPSTISAQAL
jgi:glycosyltransferase involved in cell wall biosynthesis